MSAADLNRMAFLTQTWACSQPKARIQVMCHARKPWVFLLIAGGRVRGDYERVTDERSVHAQYRIAMKQIAVFCRVTMES